MKFTNKPSKGLEVRFIGQDHDKRPITTDKDYDKNNGFLVKPAPNAGK